MATSHTEDFKSRATTIIRSVASASPWPKGGAEVARFRVPGVTEVDGSSCAERDAVLEYLPVAPGKD